MLLNLVLAFGFLLFLILFIRSKSSNKVRLSEVNTFLYRILEIGFRSNSIPSAAESIVLTLRQFYKMDFATILLFHERDQTFSAIGSNVDNSCIASLEMYCTSLLPHMKKVTSKVLSSKRKPLNYPSATLRNVFFSGFFLLYWGDSLIGAVLLESKRSAKLGRFKHRDVMYHKIRIMKSISLILQNVLYTENLISMVSTDQLTQVYNRRFIDFTLEEQLKHHRSFGLSFTLVLLDIDHFKDYNDTYGHHNGDVVLCAVAKFLQSKMRSDHEWVARYGGEEFVLFFGHSSFYDVAQRLESIKDQLSSLTLDLDNKPVGVTASFGVVTFPTVDGQASELLEKVDKALYLSKDRGRNCITVYSDN